MKKTNLKIILGLLFAVVLIFLTSQKVSADNGYTIEKYNIDMVVNEDNTFDITETITANFFVRKHGIYRKIPLKNEVKRQDGTTSKNRAIISNISVNANYTQKNESGYKVLQIGDSGRTLIGENTYIIKYKYDIGKDPVKDADELYFNLIGNEWDTNINEITFTIKMPKEFDKTLLGFSSGNYGEVNNSNIDYEVIGNTITGSLSEGLNSGMALTVRLTLPEGYFTGNIHVDVLSIITIIACIAFVVIAFIMWSKYGKEDEVVETVEFYPPEGYNSAEVGFLYKGKADSKDVISLLIYLANKGYLKIKERETKGLFAKSKGFTIIKLKDYDGTNENERIFFNDLFKKGDTVNDTDLYDSFYTTINKILRNLNSKKNKDKIFEPLAGKMGKWIILMIVVLVIAVFAKVYSIDSTESLMVPMVFVIVAIFVLTFGFSNTNGISAKIFLIVWAIMFGGMPLTITILPVLLGDTMSLIATVIVMITIVVLIVFINIMPKRSAYGNEILGKLRGFKRFLETAEKEKLEALVQENPEYFYNILPYTYALGVSDKWMEQFETIAIQAPTWYEYNGVFLMHDFNRFMTNTMLIAQTSMTSAPSSSSSGGGFSGGGFSGGGSGGGGGGSW